MPYAESFVNEGDKKSAKGASKALSKSRATVPPSGGSSTSLYQQGVDAVRSAHQKRMTKYERQVKAIKETQAAIAKLEAGAKKRRRRAELERRMRKAKKPKKPTLLKVDRVKRQVEETLGAYGKALGFTNPTKKNVVGKFIQSLEDDRTKKRYGNLGNVKKVRQTRREYRKASPAKKRLMYETGRSPDDIRETLRYRTNRKQRDRVAARKFHRSRQRGRGAYGQVYPEYFKQNRAAYTAKLRRQRREELNRTLFPEEKRQIRQTAKLVLPDRKRSKRILTKLGAPIEDPVALLRQSERALRSPETGKKTKRLARRVKRGQVGGESPYRGAIAIEKDKEGRRVAAVLTGEQLTKVKKKEREEAARIEDEETPDNPLEWAAKFGEQSVEAVKGIPDSATQAFAASRELVHESIEELTAGMRESGIPYKEHAIARIEEHLNRKAAKMEDETFDIPKTDALLKELSETSPIYGIAKTLVEGGSVEDALGEGFDRLNRNPITVLEAVPAAGAARAVTGVARHGSLAKARSVRTARPGRVMEGAKGRRQADNFARMTRQERRGQVKRKRREETAAQKRRVRGEQVPRADEFRSYSPVAAVRFLQKGRENVQALRGKDPFVVRGKRAGEREFRRRANWAYREGRVANLAYGADVVGTTKKLTRKLGGKMSTQKRAAYELAYEGSLDPDDLVGSLRAAEAQARAGEGVVAEFNAGVLGELRRDAEANGEKAIVADPKMWDRVKQLQEQDLTLEQALVRERYITPETAEARRKVAAALRTEEPMVRVARGEALPGQEKGAAHVLEAGKAADELTAAIKDVATASSIKSPVEAKKARAAANARLEAAKERIQSVAEAEIEAGRPGSPVTRLAAIEQDLAVARAQDRSAARTMKGEDSAEMTDPPAVDQQRASERVRDTKANIEALRNESQALRLAISKDAKAGRVLAREEGWAWVDWQQRGARQGMVPAEVLEKGDGGYLDYEAGKEPKRGAPQSMRKDVTGQLRSSDVVQTARLGDDKLRKTFENRARLIGMLRMKSALVQASPFKRAMDQKAAGRLINEMNQKGEVQYVAVPAGRYEGDLDVEDVSPDRDWRQDFTRKPRKGEKVYVVPEVIERVFDAEMKPPGPLTAASQYIGQRFVSAILPFSVTWHAGNAIDLMTRLLVSGVNPFSDTSLWRHLEAEMTRVWGPDRTREVLEHLRGHFGSREVDVRAADISKVTAGMKSEMWRAAGQWLGDTGKSKPFRAIVGGPGYAVQKGFDAATLVERAMVHAAGGRAARLLSRDLGIVMRDHAELARRMVEEMDSNPELVTEFGRRTLEIVGDYSGSKFSRTVLAGIDPFWTWMREANKFILYTMPKNHPVITALALQASAVGPEVAKRLGLEDVYGMSGFAEGAFPVGGMPGWFRPTSPFTAWGETARMLDDPVSYLVSRPFPYLNQALGNAAGYQWDSFGELLTRELSEKIGVDIPGFKEPGWNPQFPGDTGGKFQGDKSNLAIGSLLQSFVPGLTQFHQAQVGGFPSDTDTLFDPSAAPGSEVPVLEQPWLNPFGRRVDLDALDETEPEPTKRQKDKAHVTPNEKLEIGTTRYTVEGTKMVWNGERWEARGSSRKGRATGRGKDVSKGSPASQRAAIKKLQQDLPMLDGDQLAAIANASREYSVPPELLAAVYDVETNLGELVDVTSTAGAVGHMQFMPQTWMGWAMDPAAADAAARAKPTEAEAKAQGGYGRDGDGDGIADPYNVYDAMMSAAALLAANGADSGDVAGAVYEYNHADWYVDDVLQRAEGYRSPNWRAAGTGSGLVTNVPKGPGKKAVSRWLQKQEGDEDVEHLAPELQSALVTLARRTGAPVVVNSGYRSIQEQAALYEAYQNGTGNLAAPPGESNHNFGTAADVELTDEQRALAPSLGLGFPVDGEPWHIELVDGSATPTATAGTGAGVPSLPSYAGTAGGVPSGAPAVPSMNSERAGARRGALERWHAISAELALALLNDEIDVTEFVTRLRGASARFGNL